MAKRGPKHRGYQTDDGTIISGLTRLADGRWKVLATGFRFTETDPRLAVKRFCELTAGERQAEVVHVKASIGSGLKTLQRFASVTSTGVPMEATIGPGLAELSQPVDGQVLWAWLRQMILEQPAYVAERLGIPEIVSLARLPLPRPSLPVATLVKAYERDNPSLQTSKRAALAAFHALVSLAPAAATLDDLTVERLQAFRRGVEANQSLVSAGTRRAYFNRVKTVLAFGLKVGLDALQIRACLDRCKVLWTAAPMPPPSPKPISREHYRRLLAAAGDGPWRAWLLLGLNLAMYLEELCALTWASLNLDAGTFAAIRGKTRIPRAAVLWGETVAALRKIKRTGPYVFTSRHGSRYNRNGRVNDFAEFREAAGVPKTVTWGTLRDGAYTAAINATGVEERFARVLAGHASPGLQDAYVLRDPQVTSGACAAVHRHYLSGNP